MNDQTVTICIPTYNQAQYLPLAVQSACTQTYGAIKVWVVDDASTDDTPQVMDQLCRRYPNVVYHRQPQNLGIAENCSWMFQQPETKFIVRLDSDDLLDPHYVETLLPLMEKYPQAGYAHTAVYPIDGQGNQGGALYLARLQEYQDAETALRASVSGYRTVANIVMFRRDILHSLNFYKDRPTFVEDYDLSVRLADAGYGNIYCSKVLASYRTWIDDDKKRIKRKFVQIRGFIRVYDESVLPAFQRRGWSDKIVRKEREALAKRNAVYCNSGLFTPEERRELTQLLFTLGDSPGLRVRILMARAGLGGVFEVQNKVVRAGKLFAKVLLTRVLTRQKVNPA